MKPLATQKYDALSEAHDRLKRDFYKLQHQHEVLQENFLRLAIFRGEQYRDGLVRDMYKEHDCGVI